MGVLYDTNEKMDLASFKIYVCNAFPDLPWWHWMVMAVVALGVTFILAERIVCIRDCNSCYYIFSGIVFVGWDSFWANAQ